MTGAATRAMLRALSRALAGALAVALVFATLSLLAAGRDPEGAREALRPMLADGRLPAGTMGLPLGGRRVPALEGNDCLVLAMLVAPRDGFWRDAFSPRIPAVLPGAPPPPRCEALAEMLDPAAAPPLERYDRYLHGQRVVGALLLPWAGPEGLRQGVFLALVASLGGLALVAGGRGAAARGPGRRRDLGFAWLALGLLLFQGLPMFGRWWTHAMADLVPALFLWALYLRPPQPSADATPPGMVAEAGPPALLGAFGASVAAFELMTGGLPLATALLLLVVAIGPRPPTLRGTLLSLAAFGAGVVLPFALKLALGALAFEDAGAAAAGGSLLHRIAGPVVPEMAPSEVAAMAARGFDIQRLDTEPWLRLPYAALRLAYFGFVPGGGSIALGLGVVGGAALAVPLLAWRRWREGSVARVAAVLGACVAVLAWYGLFLSHTLLHALWMVRVAAAVLPLAAGVLMLLRLPPAPPGELQPSDAGSSAAAGRERSPMGWHLRSR